MVALKKNTKINKRLTLLSSIILLVFLLTALFNRPVEYYIADVLSVCGEELFVLDSVTFSDNANEMRVRLTDIGLKEDRPISSLKPYSYMYFNFQNNEDELAPQIIVSSVGSDIISISISGYVPEKHRGLVYPGQKVDSAISNMNTLDVPIYKQESKIWFLIKSNGKYYTLSVLINKHNMISLVIISGPYRPDSYIYLFYLKKILRMGTN